jgi:hypothetical protein
MRNEPGGGLSFMIGAVLLPSDLVAGNHALLAFMRNIAYT